MTPSLRLKLLAAVPLIWLGSAGFSLALDKGDSISPTAHEIFRFANLPVTNSMVTTWFFSIVIILLIRWAAGKPKLIPSRGQAMVESMLTGLRDIIEPMLGPQLIGKVFPLLLGLFTFILIMNWSGLLPGVGTVGLIEKDADGTPHLLYFFRPANSDLNTTLALAIVSCVAWIYYVLRYAGVKTFVREIFGNKTDKKDVPVAVYYLFSLIFLFIGLIEIVTILVRPISLSFRLYGNIFGGESIIDSMYNSFAFLLPVPFYLFEFFIGLLQAFVFTLLTAVYIGQVCYHEDSEHSDADAAPAAH
ncbi:MAG: F0F1 ATP synthase subunit A [Opitutales bacterium]